jgi:amino acid adenylation domain-containing protein
VAAGTSPDEPGQQWLLCVTAHHSILDGQSIETFLRQLQDAYGAVLAGCEPAPVEPLGIDYVDFVRWQRAQIDDGSFPAKLAFWHDHLQGAPATLNLPFDHVRPAAQSHRGARHTQRLDAAVADAIHALTIDRSATAFAVVLAAWAGLLSRYSGDPEVVVGTPVSGRSRAEFQEVIGHFVNTLPIRIDMAGDPTFSELIARVKAVTASALDHRDVPFERIVAEMNPERDSGRHPIVQTVATVEIRQDEDALLGAASMRPPAIDWGWSRFVDLALTIFQRGDCLDLSIEYSTDLFESATIERLSRHFGALFVAAEKEPDRHLSELPILLPEEREQILVDWNATGRPFPREACVHRLFEEQVTLSPFARAAELDDETLTYEELNNRANQLAHELQARGVRPGVVVGVCLDRSLEMVVALLGILKAGGCYLPLDPAYPMERLTFMLKDSGAGLIVTTSSMPSIHAADHDSIQLDDPHSALGERPTWNPQSRAKPSDLAYLMYTSGSTGTPKGVLVKHLGIVNLAAVVADVFALTASSRVLQFASFSFDASVTELLVPLTVGATVVLARRDRLASVTDLLELLDERRITTVTLPPSVLAALPDADLPNLATLCSAGEACPPEIARRWGRGRRFLNGYGPTEATVAVAYYEVSKLDERASTVPIGRAIANAEIFILDEHLEPLPVGVVGELYLGGVGLAQGYQGKPELTDERFIRHPFSPDPDARLYRSGDHGRFLADGAIEFVGRVDDQIKVRAHRVELGEIERTLTLHPLIRDAAVIARDERKAGARLTAYVVIDSTPGRSVELWPSVAEYFVYDDILYYAMTHDERRNQAYRVAMEQSVRDRVVVDIGTGQDAILARLCVEAGARRVYALEILEESFRRAQSLIQRLGLEDRIKVIHGDARQLSLPEPVDVCVSEIVGAIGGSEGAAAIINDSRRFLRGEGAVIIPSRSTTMVAAIHVPDEIVDAPAFSQVAGEYVERIFEQVGYRFDLRLCLKGLIPGDVVSDYGVFEDLEFSNEIPLEVDHEVILTMTRACRTDGLLVWLRLETSPGEWIDTLTGQHCWLPVFLPVFHPGVELGVGDVIRFTVSRRLTERKLNPEYFLRGSVIRLDGQMHPFEYCCSHDSPSYRQTSFYDRLFAGDSIPLRRIDDGTVSAQDMRNHLRQTLPDYMIPPSFVFLDALPRTPNGKVDRRALPGPYDVPREVRIEEPHSRSPIEEVVAQIWCELLKLDYVETSEDLLEAGADSLLAAAAVSRLRRDLGVELSLGSVLASPTVESMSRDVLGLLTQGDDPALISNLRELE